MKSILLFIAILATSTASLAQIADGDAASWSELIDMGRQVRDELQHRAQAEADAYIQAIRDQVKKEECAAPAVKPAVKAKAKARATTAASPARDPAPRLVYSGIADTPEMLHAVTAELDAVFPKAQPAVMFCQTPGVVVFMPTAIRNGQPVVDATHAMAMVFRRHADYDVTIIETTPPSNCFAG